MGWGCQPHTQPPTCRTRVSPFIWVITFNLSRMGGCNSSYATTSIVLRILWSLKPHHYINVRIPSGRVLLHRTFAFYILLDTLLNIVSTSSVYIFHYYVPCVFCDIFQFLLKTIGSSDEKLQEASAGCLSNIRKMALTAENFKNSQCWRLLLQSRKVSFLFLKLYQYLDVDINP